MDSGTQDCGNLPCVSSALLTLMVSDFPFIKDIIELHTSPTVCIISGDCCLDLLKSGALESCEGSLYPKFLTCSFFAFLVVWAQLDFSHRVIIFVFECKK